MPAQSTNNTNNTRIEKDLLGELAVPADAYYGVQTARALENFKISGVPLKHYPNFIKGLAMVKLAAARANYETGGFSKEVLDAIEGACNEIIDGKLHDQFLLDVIQGGAGTSTNMNANEVIANRALELMGHQKGEYKYCDPHDHVNRSQSTNDSYPTSLHIGMALGNKEVIGEFGKLVASFRDRAREFRDIMKMGRTQLQDAVPMTLGQEFDGFAETLDDEVRALQAAERVFYESTLPATQPGSSIMPGKVNPVIPEVTNMVAYRVIGNDLIVTLAGENGQLELNAFEPIMGACIFESQTLFVNAARTLRVHCVDGITANPEVCKHYLESSIGPVTALNPVIVYDQATELAAEALESGEGILEIVRERHILTDKQIEEILNPAALTGRAD